MIRIDYIILFLVAIVLGAIILPFSLVFTFFYYLFNEKKSLNDYFIGNAITLDILLNINGEWIEGIITDNRNTLFGKRGVTVSATLGELSINNKLNKKGLWLVANIDNIFFKFAKEKKHCINAYLAYEKNTL